MKNKHISIKWKIFSLFLIFAIVLIGVLWFFQIVYLNDFYKMIKRSETEDVLDQVEEMQYEKIIQHTIKATRKIILTTLG